MSEIDAPKRTGGREPQCGRSIACGQPPILNTFVPQTGQTPETAGLPFFIVIACAFLTSRLALHLTQYASVAMRSASAPRRVQSHPRTGEQSTGPMPPWPGRVARQCR